MDKIFEKHGTPDFYFNSYICLKLDLYNHLYNNLKREDYSLDLKTALTNNANGEYI
jgi:hypothetical protein